jgi:PBP1b-binding outer membrane lipoprotein LpoB
MSFIVKSIIMLLLTALATASCSSAPAHDPYNPADDQRSRAKQAQDELSSETSGK